MSDDQKRAIAQARAQYESIAEMVAALRAADEGDNEQAREDARRAIDEDALSVEVRSGWHSPGGEATGASEYRILLCTGGPACQITGDLDDYGEPESARLQYQDWFTPWIDLPRSELPEGEDVEDVLLAYAQSFYFGEG